MSDQTNLTNIRSEVSDKTKITDAVLISVFFLFICWMLFFMDEFLGFGLKRNGLIPRTAEGLWGIVTMHFLHGDWKHITQNSLGFLVLNSFLFYFYRPIAWRVFFSVLFIAPIFVWLFARGNNHIGASLLIYGEFAFLAVSGIVRYNPPLMRVALVVLTYYGSLVWYLFPIEARISFEGHIAGFSIGLITAILWRKLGPQKKVYQFETEPELPDDENAYWKIPENNPSTLPSNPPLQASEPTTITVKYHYKEKNDGELK